MHYYVGLLDRMLLNGQDQGWHHDFSALIILGLLGTDHAEIMQAAL